MIDLVDAARPVKLYGVDVFGRFFVVVESIDGQLYQVKFNGADTTSNQNEFIGYMIAKECGVPVTGGVMLRFSEEMLERIAQRVLEKYGHTVPLDIYKENVLFGSKWEDDSVTPSSDVHLRDLLADCRNKNEFYSIFPYDQYLRNYDRHHGNHLILKEGRNKKPSFYTAIDTDRIFGAVNWGMAEIEKDKIECFPHPFHQFLYELIDNASFTEVFRSAVRIEQIPSEYLNSIVDAVEHFYECDNDKLGIIRQFLLDRKSKISDECVKASCFKNVTQKGLHASHNQ